LRVGAESHKLGRLFLPVCQPILEALDLRTEHLKGIMQIFYRLVMPLGAISTTAVAILPVPTTTDASNDKTLNVTASLGINCKGSSRCYGTAAAQYLTQFIDELPDDVYYSNQKQIGAVVFSEILLNDTLRI
jgi:hypothetical protein